MQRKQINFCCWLSISIWGVIVKNYNWIKTNKNTVRSMLGGSLANIKSKIKFVDILLCVSLINLFYDFSYFIVGAIKMLSEHFFCLILVWIKLNSLWGESVFFFDAKGILLCCLNCWLGVFPCNFFLVMTVFRKISF